MKILLYIVVSAAVLLNPIRGTDVGELIPVEVIAVTRSGDGYTINTDTADTGHGVTMQAAFADLKQTASGIIYLDTAEYLLLEEGIAPDQHLRSKLKRNIKVCHIKDEITMEGIGKYLAVHRPGTRLKELAGTENMRVLIEENGRYRLVEK